MLALAHQRMLQKSMYQNPRLITFAGTTEIFDVWQAANLIVAGGTGGLVFTSTNSGNTWTTHNLTTLLGWSGDVRVVMYSWGFFGSTIAVWGTNNQAAFSSNNGSTWTLTNRTVTPADAMTDVDYTSNFLLGVSDGGKLSIDVGGTMNGGQTAAGDVWYGTSRDPNDATHVTVGTGNKIHYSIFGWPPPAGHNLGVFTKGTTSTSLGVYFDNAKNVMFINADATYGYKNQPAYTTTAPTIYTNATLTGAALRGITHDRVNKNEWMIVGQRSGTDRLWTSTQASPHVWTEWNPYQGYGVAYWNNVRRDTTNGTWVTGGKTNGSVGCVGIWKV